MKIVFPFFLISCCLLFGTAGISQNQSFADQISNNKAVAGLFKSDNDFNECAAIFYKDKMLVNDYSPRGKCKLESGMKGKLKVYSVSLSEDGAEKIKDIGFKVAIKDGRTNTIWMYSEQTYYEIELDDILKRCRPEDKLIFMTVDRTYSLPHHEVELVFGCVDFFLFRKVISDRFP